MRLHAPASSLPSLAEFYGDRLGFEQIEQTAGVVAVQAGTTQLELAASPGEPFYHFALLAPGDRFAETRDWVSERTQLLPSKDGNVVFDFSAWSAQACYFHDPAGNIVELVAHRGIGEARATGPFRAEEVRGFSELGLVGDTASMAESLSKELDLELWDGELEGPDHLGFIGEQAKTLILCPPGRPWLPTGRPAEVHPVEVVLGGPPKGEALLEDGRYRVSRVA